MPAGFGTLAGKGLTDVLIWIRARGEAGLLAVFLLAKFAAEHGLLVLMRRRPLPEGYLAGFLHYLACRVVGE